MAFLSMLAETEFSLIFEEQSLLFTSSMPEVPSEPHGLLKSLVVLKVLRCAIFKLLQGSRCSKLEAATVAEASAHQTECACPHAPAREMARLA